MPGKSESHKTNADRPQKQHRGQKASHEETPGNSGAHRQQKQGKISDNMSSSQQQGQNKNLVGSSKKNGCLPKLFMLLLPFVTIGLFVFLGS
ncbi:MAG: hypothetical protein CVU44_06320 [Chloroflexi bacterium HGW-Chloroflexi-6]|nr:MAG: hypothetical protein CVU44_06320 [Chloroflexi bacterium HGW-Chloroflexi-6]